MYDLPSKQGQTGIGEESRAGAGTGLDVNTFQQVCSSHMSHLKHFHVDLLLLPSLMRVAMCQPVFDKIVMSMHEASEVRRGNVFIRVCVSLCLSACPWRVY